MQPPELQFSKQYKQYCNIRTKYTGGLYYNFLIEYVPFGIIVCQSHEINVKCGLEPLILKRLIPINSILILHINNSLCQLLIL